MGRIMGVDVGRVRIGVAVSDESGLIACPLETVRRTSDRRAVAELCRLAAEQEITTIVVGLPLSMDGGEQDSSGDARRMADRLRSRSGLSVQVWDERMTSVQAERALLEGGMRRGKRRQVIDRVAAAVMLQSYLDSRPRGEGESSGGAAQ